MEIDEVAARLLKQYWAVLVVCVVVPLIAISYLTAKQSALYAASARIITGDEVPQTSAAADAVANQVQAIATGRSAVTQALQAAGAQRNLSNFISNDITVSGLGSSQVIDLTVTDRSPQVAQQVARVLSAWVVRSINNVGQSGLRAALAANDHEIVRLSQQRADLATKAAAQPQNQQLQAEMAGIDEVIAGVTGDRSRLLIQAGTLGLATVIDQPALPAGWSPRCPRKSWGWPRCSDWPPGFSSSRWPRSCGRRCREAGGQPAALGAHAGPAGQCRPDRGGHASRTRDGPAAPAGGRACGAAQHRPGRR